MKKFKFFLFLGFTVVLSLVITGLVLRGDEEIIREIVKGEVLVLPDSLLREYDPIIIIFPTNVVKSTGLEKQPEKYVQIYNKVEGEFYWVNERTLQFKPFRSWKPLKKYTVKVGDYKKELYTALATPINIYPPNASKDLPAISKIVMEFEEEPDVEDIKKVIKLKVVDLEDPFGQGIMLSPEEYTIKKLDKTKIDETTKIVIMLKKEITQGKKLILFLYLSLGDNENYVAYEFSTKRDFYLVGMGTDLSVFPVSKKGTVFTSDQAITISQRGYLVFQFSDSLSPSINFETVRNLIRFSPAVENISFSIEGSRLLLRGDFKPNILYKVTVYPLKDFLSSSGIAFKMERPSSFFFFLSPKEKNVKWFESGGIVERYGPKEIPIYISGYRYLDIKVYRISPTDERFINFPEHPVLVDEGKLGPASGESRTLEDHIKSLSYPIFSDIVDLGEAVYGTTSIDLGAILEKYSLADKPGTYLVGYRVPDKQKTRVYVKVVVTDLSLTFAEDSREIFVFVYSLKTALPIAGANITIKGVNRKGETVVIKQGITDFRGLLRIPKKDLLDYYVREIKVEKDGDILVLPASSETLRFNMNYWERVKGVLWSNISVKEESAEYKAVIFTERPIYRPDESVYIKGIIRRWKDGFILYPEKDMKAKIVIYGPDEEPREFKTKISEFGTVYLEFKEKNPPTGDYLVKLFCDIDKDKNFEGDEILATTSFKIATYKLPKFEVNIISSDRVPLDKAFKIVLKATYYAGGPVQNRPVKWNITEIPYAYTPKKYNDYVFSTDSRFSGIIPTSARQRTFSAESQTDPDGFASIKIDPTLDIYGYSRKYFVEATVIGEGQEAVTTAKDILGLPAFTLGLKLEKRIIKEEKKIKGKFILVDENEELKGDIPVVISLIKRDWVSYLLDTSLQSGVPQYRTVPIDTKLEERVIKSKAEENNFEFTVSEAGVYVVKIEARDNLGRLQAVSLEAFVGGIGEVSWEKQEENLLTVVPDKASYKPGETANILIQTPYKNGKLIVCIEEPKETLFEVLDVDGGKVIYTLNIKPYYIPRIPIHFIFIKPRTSDIIKDYDLGKPQTFAGSIYLNVLPVKHIIDIEIKHPEQVGPGEKVRFEVYLRDQNGKPVSGELAFWLFDQAVLSLENEKPINIPYQFIGQVNSQFVIYDLRNLVFGKIPKYENPGGEESEIRKGMGREEELLKLVTVRKIFKTVPYYNPSIKVGEDGKAVIEVELPDNLTIFQIRAVAVNKDMFGVKKSAIKVRLPVVVQPILPRFVRYGDTVKLGGIARVISGEYGEGICKIEVEGAKLLEEDTRKFNFSPTEASRLLFKVKVKERDPEVEGEELLTVKLSVMRLNDKKGDAFLMQIPILPESRKIVKGYFTNLVVGESIEVDVGKEFAEGYKGKLRLYASPEGNIIRAITSMEFLYSYRYECLEQLISRVYPFLVYKDIVKKLNIGFFDEMYKYLDKIVYRTLERIEDYKTDSGLYAFWPGTEGSVYVTAYLLEFLVQAKASGYPIEQAKIDGIARVLQQSLRADYGLLLDRYSLEERVSALKALSTAGYFDPGYGVTLASHALFASPEAKANLLYTLKKVKFYNDIAMKKLTTSLWDDLVFLQKYGKKYFAGMNYGYLSWEDVYTTSEVAVIAETFRALSYQDKFLEEYKLMLDTLAEMGDETGWGNTYANSRVLLAISEYLSSLKLPPKDYTLKVSYGNTTDILKLKTPENRVILYEKTSTDIGKYGKVKIGLEGEKGEKCMVYVETSYLPSKSGEKVPAYENGFSLKKELMLMDSDGNPKERFYVDKIGIEKSVKPGDIIEYHIELENPKPRYYVALDVGLPGGFEIMDPSLKLSSKLAIPSKPNTINPSYTQILDDRAVFYFKYLPKGTYHFYFRARATTEGEFVEPGAKVEMMYRPSIVAYTPGIKFVVK